MPRPGPLALFLLVAAAAGVGAAVVSFVARAPAPAAPPSGPRPRPEPRPRKVSVPVNAPSTPLPIEGLAAPDPLERRRVLMSVQKAGDAANAAPLLDFVAKEEDRGLRVLAFAALGNIKDPAVAGRLLDIYVNSRDEHMRLLALEEAGNIGGPDVEHFFLRLIAEPEAGKFGSRVSDIVARGLAAVDRTEVVEALADYLDRPAASARDPALDARGMLIEEMGRRGGARRVAVLLRVASSTNADWETREDAVSTLGDMEGPEAFAALKRLLAESLSAGLPANDMEDLRILTLAALGERKEPEALRLLTAVARGEFGVDEHLLRGAVNAISFLATPEAAAVLLEVARNGERPESVRAAAWYAYGRAAGAAGSATLAEAALSAPTERERVSAVRSLEFLKREDCKSAAERILAETRDAEVRKLAQRLL